MTDAFEVELEGLFADQPDMPDALAFAQQVERELDRTSHRFLFVSITAAVIAAGLTLPALGKVLTSLTDKSTVLLEQTSSLTPNTSLMMAAGMMVAGSLAVLFGRYQASRL
jgi:hypothetical protein